MNCMLCTRQESVSFQGAQALTSRRAFSTGKKVLSHVLSYFLAKGPVSFTDLTDLGRGWLWGRLGRSWGRLRRGLRWVGWLGLWLGLKAVGGDLVNLSRRRHIHHVVGLHFDFVARWQEGVEAHDQVRVALEQLRHAADHAWSVNAGGGKTRRNSFPQRICCRHPTCAPRQNK